MYVCPSHFVVLFFFFFFFFFSQLLLQYLMQGLKTCNSVRHALNMCIEETEFGFPLLLQNYVPLNDIHVLTIFPCLMYNSNMSVSTTNPYFDHIIVPYVKQYSTFLVSTNTPAVYKTDSTCFCRIISLVMT